jgi:hypothetical protein
MSTISHTALFLSASIHLGDEMEKNEVTISSVVFQQQQQQEEPTNKVREVSPLSSSHNCPPFAPLRCPTRRLHSKFSTSYLVNQWALMEDITHPGKWKGYILSFRRTCSYIRGIYKLRNISHTWGFSYERIIIYEKFNASNLSTL